MNHNPRKFPLKPREQQIKELAWKLLKKFNVTGPPVPVKKIMEHFCMFHHFKSSWYPGFEKEHGFSLPDPNIPGFFHVFLNEDLVSGRDNFTMSHEGFHVIYDHHQFLSEKLTAEQYKLLDDEADIFTGYFLMWDEWVLKDIRLPITVQEIGRLKERYDVSWAAMIMKLIKLNVVSKKAIDRLFDEYKKQKGLQKRTRL